MSDGAREPPRIGSDEWWDELAELGVSRTRIARVVRRGLLDTFLDGLAFELAREAKQRGNESLTEEAFEEGRVDFAVALELAQDAYLESPDFRIPDLKDVSAHDFKLSWAFSTPLERAAFWVLYHQVRPLYEVLMQVRLDAWHDDEFEPAHRRWLVRQYAAMLLDPDEQVAESAGYHLWVDPFETPDEVEFVFREVSRLIPEHHLGHLLPITGPVPWELKADLYRLAAENPDLHHALARGLAGSFYDVYGQVDAAEAAEIWERLHLENEPLQKALAEVTSEPMELWVRSVIHVDEPGWHEPPAYLVSACALNSRIPWVPQSEVWHEGREIGRAVHASFPFDESVLHELLTTERESPCPRQNYVLYRIEGPQEDSVELPGQTIALWPPGLRDLVS